MNTKSILTPGLTLILFLFLSSCASKYYQISPPSVRYNSHEMKDGINLSYKYDVLKETYNKKYAKKEEKRGIRLVAVKVTNNTGSVINIGQDVAFYSGPVQIVPMDPMAIKETIKQIVPGYLPYLLFTFTNLYVNSGYTVKTYPIGLALGPGLTIGNMAVAGKANSLLLNDLESYNILNRTIQKGETAYGLIGIPDPGYRPLTLKFKDENE